MFKSSNEYEYTKFCELYNFLQKFRAFLVVLCHKPKKEKDYYKL
jgi:hypothetical protein